MMGKTHLIIGGAAWLGVCTIPSFPIHSPAAIAGGYFLSALGALGPDIDQRRSMQTKMLGPITRALSYVIREAFGGHRKITHSILGTLIIGLIFYSCVKYLHLQPWVAYAYLTGWVSHILADMITYRGCPLLWPIDKHENGIKLVNTDSKVEYLGVVPIALFGTLALTGMLVLH